MTLLIILTTVLVSLMVPKPVMFEAAVIGAFLAVGSTIFSLPNGIASVAATLIVVICIGVPIYRLLKRD